MAGRGGEIKKKRKGRFVGSSAGTDEDCPPVNELNASNPERTTAGLQEGGRDGVTARTPPLS